MTSSDNCGLGAAQFKVEPGKWKIYWNISWTIANVSSILLAGPGLSEPIPVQIDFGEISGTVSPAIGEWNLTQTQITQLTSGLLYVVVRSNSCSLTGQIKSAYAPLIPPPLPPPPIVDIVPLVAVSGCDPQASGQATLSLTQTSHLFWDVIACNIGQVQTLQLRGPATPPSSGPLQVDFGLSGLNIPAKGSVQLNQLQAQQYMEGLYYVVLNDGPCSLRGNVRANSL